MERRQFFRNSFLISGVVLSSGALKAGSFFPDKPKPVERYLAFIGAEMLEGVCDDCLESLARTRSESLLKVGYAQKGRPYALDKQEHTLVFRYELLSASSGCVDTCLLFFEKDVTGKWVYSATLTGFHLDALAGAIENPSLTGRTPYRDSFIPAVQSGRYCPPGRINMRKGALEIVTRIEENGHRISVRLFSGCAGEADVAFDLSRRATRHFWA